MGDALGCKMSQSSPSTLRGGGVFFTTFSHVGLVVFFGCDCTLSTHSIPIFPMEKNCDISLPPPRIESSLGSTSAMGLDVSFKLCKDNWCCYSKSTIGSISTILVVCFCPPINSENIDLLSMSTWVWTCWFSNMVTNLPSISFYFISMAIIQANIFPKMFCQITHIPQY